MTIPPVSPPKREQVREALAFLETRPDLVQQVERRVFAWLQADARRMQQRLGGGRKRPFRRRSVQAYSMR